MNNYHNKLIEFCQFFIRSGGIILHKISQISKSKEKVLPLRESDSMCYI